MAIAIAIPSLKTRLPLRYHGSSMPLASGTRALLHEVAAALETRASTSREAIR